MRFRVLDGWRGVCALIVALLHFSARGYLFSLPLVRNAWLFVDFFFVLSGFVIAHAYGERLADWRGAKEFMARRFARLWPLHAAVLAGLILLEASKLLDSAAAATAFAGARSLSAILTNLFLLQSLGLHGEATWNDPSWSISTEFYTYLVFALVCVLTVRRARTVLFVSLALLGVSVLWLCSRYGMRETFGWGFFRCLYGFFTGCLTYGVWQRWRLAPEAATLREIAAIGLVVAFVWFAPAERSLEYFAPLVFAFAVWIFAQEQGALSRLLQSRPLATLGRWSYSIYMVHALVLALLFSALAVFGSFLDSRGLHDDAIVFAGRNISDAVAIVYLLAVIGFSALTYRFVELPGQRLAPKARPR